MKKVVLLAAMLAMMLVAAAPAFAQTAIANNGGSAAAAQYQNQYLACNQVLNVGGDFAQYGGTLNFNQICTQAGRDAFVNVATGEVATANQVAGNQVISVPEAQAAVASAGGAVAAVPATGAAAVLPDTGGASLFALGAGTLLVAGGLLARRIVR